VEIRFVASLLHHARIGIIVPRYKHTAVERNRLKRRLREIMRQHVLPNLASSAMDVVVRALPAAYDASFANLVRDVSGGMQRATSRVAP
jgi:ribonuclease P protein component